MITYGDVFDWLSTTQSADMSPRTRRLLRDGFRRRFEEHRNMDDIGKMIEHIEALRELLQDFDRDIQLDIHNDVSNPDHIQQAITALDALDGHVNDLVP